MALALSPYYRSCEGKPKLIKSLVLAYFCSIAKLNAPSDTVITSSSDVSQVKHTLIPELYHYSGMLAASSMNRQKQTWDIFPIIPHSRHEIIRCGASVYLLSAAGTGCSSSYPRPRLALESSCVHPRAAPVKRQGQAPPVCDRSS